MAEDIDQLAKVEDSQYAYKHQIDEKYLKQMRDHFDRFKVSNKDVDTVVGPQDAQGRFREYDHIPWRADKNLRFQGAAAS